MDIRNLKKKWTPNQYLVCPDGYARSPADAAPVVYQISPVELSRLWRAVIAQEPRTREVRVSDDGLMLHHTQKSKLVGFVDDIFSEIKTVETQAETHATVYVYSRSRLGISDRGVNKKRIQHWLNQLDQAVASGP